MYILKKYHIVFFVWQTIPQDEKNETLMHISMIGLVLSGCHAYDGLTI